VVYVPIEFSAAVAIDCERIAVDVVAVGFVTIAVDVADKFSANAEVLSLHVDGAPGIETDGGGVLH